MSRVKVRVGQQPAVKVLTTGTSGGGSGGGGSIETLSDTLITNPKQDGQILVYQSSIGRWVNASTASELNVDGGVY
jgi:hypothetical protein